MVICMRDWVKMLGWGAISCFALSALIVLAAIASLFMGKPGLGDTANAAIPVIALLSFVVCGLFYLPSVFLALQEIWGSKNSGEWKVAWMAIVLLVFFLGLILYLCAARKGRK